MDDKIIKVNETNYSMKKILGCEGWEIYKKTSDKVRALTDLKVTMDLYSMEKGFKELDKKI